MGFNILSNMQEALGQMKDSFPSLAQLYNAGLNDPEGPVQAAALRALGALMTSETIDVVSPRGPGLGLGLGLGLEGCIHGRS